MKSEVKMTKLKYAIAILFLAVGIIVLKNPIRYFPDSEGYVDMLIFRSAGYPVFLDLVEVFFGAHFITGLIVVQLLLGFMAILVFIKTLIQVLKLNQIWYILLIGILLMPYFFHNSVANRVLSEGLAYPLYLLVINYYILALYHSKTKYFWYALAFLFGLILTRTQFLFLVPVGILVLINTMRFEKKRKPQLLILVMFIATPFLMSLTDKTFHKIKHEHFVNTPWTGIHLIAPAFFVADADDFTIYRTEKEQQFFKTVYKRLSEKQLNIHNLDTTKKFNSSLKVYIDDYSKIANATVFKSAMELYPNVGKRKNKIIKVDELTKKMALPLIFNNYKEYIKLAIRNFIHGFLDDKILIIFLITFIVSLYQIIKKRNVFLYQFFALITLLAMSNMAIVAIGMHTISRFTFYNYWVLPLLLIILLDQFISSKKTS